MFACLTMLAFGIDQLRKACCPLFQAVLARKERAKFFREGFRSMFTTFPLPDWGTFHRALAFGYEAPVPVPFDTSRPGCRAEPRSDHLASLGKPISPPLHPDQAWRSGLAFSFSSSQAGSRTARAVSGSICSVPFQIADHCASVYG